MKKLTSWISYILACLIIYSCNKASSTTDVIPINCNGLITDTLGKNDIARISVPNAFTPNGDGVDDYFYLDTYKIDSIDFTVYDENNNIVFNTTTLGNGWRPQADGISWKKFYYKIQAVTTNNNKIGICGQVYKLMCIPSFLSRDSLKFSQIFDSAPNCP